MRTLFGRLLPALVAVSIGGDLGAQPPGGSQIPLDRDACATCHAEADHWDEKTRRFHMPLEDYAEDVHRKKGVNCHDCHGGDPAISNLSQAHAKADGFRDLEEVKKVCGNCHKEEAVGLVKGVHAKAGEKDVTGRGTTMECLACHGGNQHLVFPVEDARSAVFLDNLVKTCGGCHGEELETYEASVHGQGLHESGLSVTASCADCHGAHEIYLAADNRSTLHAARVADTCGACHRFISQWLQESVHGRGNGPGGLAERVAPGGEEKRKPSCTDCHQGHDFPRPGTMVFQSELPTRCGNCHADLSSRYAMSMHGELTRLGYAAAAQCSDCHGTHEILPVSDPRSSLAEGENRLAVCKKCHVHAVPNFSQFDPHANHKDTENYPLLHFAYAGLRSLFFFFFGFFVIHGLMWFVRAFVDTLQRGRHKTLVTGETALIRFEPIHRLLYGILLACFLGLILTGLPLKYSDQAWARSLARWMGGFESTSVWHHCFAAVAIFGCVGHVAWALTKIVKLRKERTAWREILFGPDSPVPTTREIKDMVGMGRWFFGLGPKPRFERWTYWEKYDYWAVYLAAGVIGISGLLLWYPNVFCRVLPGEVLNFAKVIHAEVAILAASFLFMFHFFHTHFRPEKFPMDLSALTGLVSQEHLEKYRPEYVERLRRTGKLEAIRRRAPSRRRLWVAFLAGLVVFSLGLGLLAVVVLAALGK